MTTFQKAHLEVLAAADFFSVEVLTLKGLVRTMIFFVIDVATRKVEIAGVKVDPDGRGWRRSREISPIRGTGSFEGGAISFTSEASLRRAIDAYLVPYHWERGHQAHIPHFARRGLVNYAASAFDYL